MRKNLLALSIAAMVGGLSGVAAHAAPSNLPLFDTGVATNTAPENANTPAVVGALPQGSVAAQTRRFNGDGLGHVLLVPYFTTNGGNKSLLNIVNTDQVNGKAVKLRYRNALNSDDIFDITIYLSPGDVWAADVAEENGFSRLVTDDTSCTLPTAAEIKAKDNGRFKTNRVLGGAATGAIQTREGYIEILNSADIRPFLNDVNGNPDVTKPNPLYAATKHVDGKVSCNPAILNAQATPLSNDANSPNSPRNRGYSWPTGGLFANWVIVNAADKASFSGEAAAVVAATDNQVAVGNLVWFPQTTDSVSAAVAATLSADPLLASGRVEAAMYDFPDLSTPYTTLAADPVAQALALSNSMAVKSVSNEYLTGAGGAFATDWVFSMPTRRYQIAVDYANSVAVQILPVTAARHFVVRNPATGANLDGNVSYDRATQRLCVATSTMRGFDREENSKTTFVISPDSALSFCGEATVVSFNKKDYSILGAATTGPVAIRSNIETGLADGWFTMATPGYNNNGLPVLGFAAAKMSGVNLGGTWAHRVTR